MINKTQEILYPGAIFTREEVIKIMDDYAQQDVVDFLDWIANMDYPVLIGGKTKPDIDYQKYKTWEDLYKGFKTQQDEPPLIPETKPHEKGWPDIITKPNSDE